MSLTALEMSGTIDENQQLRLDGLLPKGPKQVRVILLYPVDELTPDAEIDEQTWLKTAAHNPAFAFLADPAEDIYTITDGQPFQPSHDPT